MNIPLFIIGWVLILFFIIAVSLVAYFAQRTDQCRTWKILYCYADNTSGWRCADPNAGADITLNKTLADVASTTQLVPCPSTADIPGVDGKETVYASYVLAPSPESDNVFCDTTIPDPTRPVGCRSTGPLGQMITFAGDPLVVPTDGKVSSMDVFNWFCDPTRGKNGDNDPKTVIWKNFLKLNPDFQVSRPIQFQGQTG